MPDCSICGAPCGTDCDQDRHAAVNTQIRDLWSKKFDHIAKAEYVGTWLSGKPVGA